MSLGAVFLSAYRGEESLSSTKYMKYKHALFLNPYFASSAHTVMKIFPPTGLEHVATSAKGYVEKVTLMDLRYEPELADATALVEFIQRQEVDIVCAGIGWDRQLTEICEMLNQMPPDMPVVVGGYTATEKVEELFESCPKIDIIVRGEGEETIREILAGAPLDTMLGISFRRNGTIVHNKYRPLPDVNTLPAPDRSLRRNSYRPVLCGVNMAHGSFDTVLSARGCPFHCKFCTFSLNPLGQKRNYAARAPQAVVDEIAGLDAEVILMSDENFTVYPQRAEEICDMIISRGIKKRFMAQVRIDVAKHPRLLEKMVKAGFKALLMGIESPHDWILKQLDKGFDSKTIREAFTVLRTYPILYQGYFIYGNIGEKEEEMLYIADFAKEIGVDVLACSKLRIERFSPLRELAEKTPGYHVTERGELYSDRYSHPALKKIGKRIKWSFYTPVRLLKILIKSFRIEFITLREVASLLAALPVMLFNAVLKAIRKNRFRRASRQSAVRSV